MISTFLSKALQFASTMHTMHALKPDGMIRRHTNEPYINHPIRVAVMAGSKFGLDEMAQAIALNHDVLEDTSCTYDQMVEALGQPVADGVRWLTDTPVTIGGPNRKARKKIDNERLASAPDYIQTIKCCDSMDNTPSIIKYDPDFAKGAFLMEKWVLLPQLTRADPYALEKAMDEVRAGMETFGLFLREKA